MMIELVPHIVEYLLKMIKCLLKTLGKPKNDNSKGVQVQMEHF